MSEPSAAGGARPARTGEAMPSDGAASHAALHVSLSRGIDDVLRPLLRGVERVALVGFPDHPNVGDSAVFLGQLACLRRMGIAPRFVCDGRTYDAGALVRRIGEDGVILLSGGGDFGDLWEGPQRLRERTLRDFPRHRIVQLPQSIRFEREENLERVRRLCDGHERLVLLARDERSLEVARRFDAETALCPDMAFALPPPPPPGWPRFDVVWLARADREAAGTRPAGRLPPGTLVTDWNHERLTALHRLDATLADACRRRPDSRLLRRAATACQVPFARRRLRRGRRLLADGGVVITDRLHGHVLALLLGIPHVLLDTRHGKLADFHRTWTGASDLVHRAGSAPEALDLARALAGRPPRGRGA